MAVLFMLVGKCPFSLTFVLHKIFQVVRIPWWAMLETVRSLSLRGCMIMEYGTTQSIRKCFVYRVVLS